MKKKQNKFIDILYGFWKYLGLTGVFFTGVILSYYGAQVLINDLSNILQKIGFIGYIALSPLVCGLALSWMSFAEFLRIIREDNG